jgi:hypothetical protein
VSGQLHAPSALPPGKEPPRTHWLGGWVSPRAGLHDVEWRKILTLPGLELLPLGRPAGSQLLYRQRHRIARSHILNIVHALPFI